MEFANVGVVGSIVLVVGDGGRLVWGRGGCRRGRLCALRNLSLLLARRFGLGLDRRILDGGSSHFLVIVEKENLRSNRVLGDQKDRGGVCVCVCDFEVGGESCGRRKCVANRDTKSQTRKAEVFNCPFFGRRGC